MLTTCWSAKGGVGTTVVAAALGLLLADRAGRSVLADLAGDLPAALGVAEPTGRGLAGWLADGAAAPLPLAEAVPVGHGLSLLGRGRGELVGDGAALAEALARCGAPAVVDAGVPTGPALDLALAAPTSLLVLRPCFLALRRAALAPLRPTGVVLVAEPGRALGAADVEAALGVPVLATVPWDEAVARRVDAGLLPLGVPAALARALRRAA